MCIDFNIKFEIFPLKKKSRWKHFLSFRYIISINFQFAKNLSTVKIRKLQKNEYTEVLRKFSKFRKSFQQKASEWNEITDFLPVTALQNMALFRVNLHTCQTFELISKHIYKSDDFGINNTKSKLVLIRSMINLNFGTIEFIKIVF